MGTDGQAELRAALLEYRDLAARLCDIDTEISAVRASAQSADGLVTATVNAQGALVDLKVDGRMRTDLQAVTTGVLEASGLAAAQARRRVGDMMAQALPTHLKRLVGPDGTLDTTALRPNLDPRERSR
jgi:DNA-binding protein YbaB